MNVLSLFDGKSGAYSALKSIGITPTNYFASEVDKYSQAVSKYHFPDIIRLGDVNRTTFFGLPKIDLLIAGFPCQAFSVAGKQLNFEDPRGKLFFELIRLIHELKPRYFLLENVRMKKEIQYAIDDLVGVKPILINSSLVSAQSRNRLYWTNIPNIIQPEDKHIMLKDIIIEATTERDKSFCITASYYKGVSYSDYIKRKSRQMVKTRNGGELVVAGIVPDSKFNIGNTIYDVSGKAPTLNTRGDQKYITTNTQLILAGTIPNTKFECGSRVYDVNGKSPTMISHHSSHPNITTNGATYRKLTPLECERLQTYPDDYTKYGIIDNKVVEISNAQRYKMIGNGFTRDVIAHILNFIKEKR